MAEISPALVMKLRKMSGQGIMDCKKALEESGGNVDEAMSILRKKGLATLAKRAQRETNEGLVICKKSADGRTVAIATLCCETDFVAKSDDFVAAANILSEYILACGKEGGTENILKTVVGGRSFEEVLTELVSKTGEKVEVGDFARFGVDNTGVIGSYVHFNNKLGSMVEIEADSESTAGGLTTIATDLAMHITAINPVAVDHESVDPAVLEKERAIAAEQAKGKPANIIEKIVEGKIAKFFRDNCLVDQAFVKDDTKSVACVLEQAARSAGGKAKIKRFIRFEIG